jgi:hypothetical protein
MSQTLKVSETFRASYDISLEPITGLAVPPNGTDGRLPIPTFGFPLAGGFRWTFLEKALNL